MSKFHKGWEAAICAHRKKAAARYQEILDKGERACIKCGKIKLLSEFPENRKKRSGQPRYAYCKPCHTVYQRKNKLQRFFNLSIDDYNLILAYQNGKCAICDRPVKEDGIRLSVDHSHKTGLIRGCLCWLCNRALGMLREDVERVKKILDYLQNPPAVRALGEERFGQPGRVGNKKATTKRLVSKAKKALDKQTNLVLV